MTKSHHLCGCGRCGKVDDTFDVVANFFEGVLAKLQQRCLARKCGFDLKWLKKFWGKQETSRVMSNKCLAENKFP